MDALSSDRTAESLRTEFYRQAYTLAVNEFETEDDLVSLYLYTIDHEIISTYRRAVTPKHNYAVDIYQDMEMENAQIVKEYVESDNEVMLTSSYYNP